MAICLFRIFPFCSGSTSFPNLLPLYMHQLLSLLPLAQRPSLIHLAQPLPFFLLLNHLSSFFWLNPIFFSWLNPLPFFLWLNSPILWFKRHLEPLTQLSFRLLNPLPFSPGSTSIRNLCFFRWLKLLSESPPFLCLLNVFHN